MNISVEQLLAKIEDQLKEAKNSSSDARIRERVYAIKSLCELVLEQDRKVEGSSYQQPAYSQVLQPVQIPTNIPAQTIQPAQKKLNTEEGNGDSLFDF